MESVEIAPLETERFERVLGLNRERIERLYRGRGDMLGGNAELQVSCPGPDGQVREIHAN